MKTFVARTAEQWRKWLDEHHDSESEVRFSTAVVKGKTYFELERFGAPSRWNTLRALRVLKWWGDGPGGKQRRGRLASTGMQPTASGATKNHSG